MRVRTAWWTRLLLQCRYTDSWCLKDNAHLAHMRSNALQQKGLVAWGLCRHMHSLIGSAGEQPGWGDADTLQQCSQAYPELALHYCRMPKGHAAAEKMAEVQENQRAGRKALQ